MLLSENLFYLLPCVLLSNICELYRYDEYGEGRTSASNSDQTGTLSRASYHSSDPEQYPDLLDIPNR